MIPPLPAALFLSVSRSRSPFAATALAVLAAALAAPTSAAVAAPILLLDIDSGQVLHAEEATRPWYPASTTKIMTAYLALKAVREGRMTPDTPLTASANAARQPRSKAFIRAGQTVTLDNALKLLMVKSANDIAVVIAENVGGSVESFAAMMNAEAQRLGMRETHFVNPHGWHDPAHVSSARDLAILSSALLREFPAERGYWGIGAIQLGNRIMRNTNGLIGRYAGASGIKTGFVCASGFNVVATAERNGRRYMAVVLGAANGKERTALTAELLSGGGRGPGGSLSTLPEVGGEAPNMREEICTRRARAGRPVAEEEAPVEVVAAPGNSENPALAFLASPTGAATATPSSLARFAALGPRETFVPIPVWFGPAPGATAAAATPRGARLARPATPPAAATAATPASAPTRAAARRPAAEIVADAPESPATSPKPTARPRPGAIGGGLEPTTARPSGAAAIRPKPALARATTDMGVIATPATAQPTTAARPTSVKPASVKATPAKPTAARPGATAVKPTAGKPAASKPAAAKPTAAKPAAKRGGAAEAPAS